MSTPTKKGRKTTFVFILMVVALSITATVGFLNSTDQIDLTPEQFQPVRVQSAQFDVRSIDGTLLGSIDGMSNIRYFTPQSNNNTADDYWYPKVDIMYSQPFMSDSGGVPLNELAVEPYHIPTQKYIVNGTAYFLNTYYMSMDIGARTYSNLPIKKDTTTYLSPWRNYHYTYTAPLCTNLGSHTYTSANNPEVIGSLVMVTDVGVNPWRYTFAPTKATISTSLEPIEFQLSTWNNAPSAGKTFADAIAKLQTQYGNRKVVVQPKIKIDGLSNYIRYSYEDEQQLPDGTSATIKVNTKSALVGFADAYKAPFDSSDKVGLIPNFFSSQYKVTGLSPTDKPVETSENNAMSDQKSLPLTAEKRTITGSVTVEQTYENPSYAITGGAVVHGIQTNLNNLDDIYIDLNQLDKFSLPEDLFIDAEFELQPKTSIKVAHATVRYSAWWYDAAFPCFTDETIGGDVSPASIDWPYAINIENVYAVSRCTWKMHILTENEIQGVYANGQPIDVSKLTDFELSEIVNNPNMDNMQTGLEFVVPNSTVIAIITIVIVIVIVIIVLVTLPKILKMIKRPGFGAKRNNKF